MNTDKIAAVAAEKISWLNDEFSVASDYKHKVTAIIKSAIEKALEAQREAASEQESEAEKRAAMIASVKRSKT